MKNYLKFSLIFLLLGCGARHSKVEKRSKELAVQTEQITKVQIQKDSTAKKETASEQTTKTSTLAQSWKYTAPIYITKDSLIYRDRPFWLKLNGDSIDVGSLPYGASLESRSESSESSSWMQTIISELTRKNELLTAENKKKQEIKYIETEKIREVERQGVQWILLAVAFVLGLSLPSALRGGWYLIKSRFKI